MGFAHVFSSMSAPVPDPALVKLLPSTLQTLKQSRALPSRLHPPALYPMPFALTAV